MENLKWVRKFNELFEYINQEDTSTYFSGPRFIGIIREFDLEHPDYNQYMEDRKRRKLNTSRKNYFFDILSMFQEDIRDKIIQRIYEVANE